jgi:hypothetical protein
MWTHRQFLLFFVGRGRIAGEFSYFAFFGVAEAPTIITTKADPLPPHIKSHQSPECNCQFWLYELQVVDFIDVFLNDCKLLAESV